MNKIGRPTCLSNDKEYFVVSSSGVGGGHGLPLDINYLFGQLQCFIKDVKCWCVDNDILKNLTPQVFPPSFQAFQLKG